MARKATVVEVRVEPSDPRPRGVFVSADPSEAAFARRISRYERPGEDCGFDTVGPQRVPWNDHASPVPTTLHPRESDTDGD